MKTFKKIAKGLLIVIVLLIVIAFFLPRNAHIERSLVMNAPAAIIFEQANTVKNLHKWSPWQKMDPNIQITYNEIPSGVGAKYSWVSKNGSLGEGSETIIASNPSDSLQSTLNFNGHGQATSGYRFEPAEGGTKVTWYFKSDIGMNPIGRWMMVLGKGSMEKTFDQGLADLKTLVEAMPKSESKKEIKVEMTEVKAAHYLAVRDTASMTTISHKLGTGYGLIMAAMAKQKLTETGAVFAIYYGDSKTHWDMDAGIPVDKAGKADGNVKPGEMKAGNAVVAHYFGNYMGTSAAHEAIQEYVKANNKKINGAPWEVYITDPGVEKDTAKWQTDVYYPVE